MNFALFILRAFLLFTCLVYGKILSQLLSMTQYRNKLCDIVKKKKKMQEITVT